jgi:PAS domain-containing protein
MSRLFPELEQIREVLQMVDERLGRGELFASLFHESDEAAFVTDGRSRILEANLAAVDLLGVPARRVRDKLLVSFVPLVERAVFRMRLADLANTRWNSSVQPRHRPTRRVDFVLHHCGAELHWRIRAAG